MAERGYGWEKLISEMFCQEYWAERQMKTFITSPASTTSMAVGDVGWRAGEGPGGPLPESYSGDRRWDERNQDLGRRNADS